MEVVCEPVVALLDAHLLTLDWRAVWEGGLAWRLLRLCLPLKAILVCGPPQREQAAAAPVGMKHSAWVRLCLCSHLLIACTHRLWALVYMEELIHVHFWTSIPDLMSVKLPRQLPLWLF